MHVLEPAFLGVTVVAIRADVAVRAVKVPALAAVRTTPSTGAVLEHQLLAGTQALAVVVVAVAAGLTSTVEVVIVADLFVAHAVGQPLDGCLVGAGEGWVQALVVGVQQDVLAERDLFAGDVDGFGCCFAHGCP